MRLPSGPELFHACTGFHLEFQRTGIEAAVAPGDLFKINRVLYPDIMKGDQRAFRDAVADGGLPGENVIKERSNIDAVGAFRRGGETQQKGGMEPGDELSISWRFGVVDLVDDDVVERLGVEGRKTFGS